MCGCSHRTLTIIIGLSEICIRICEIAYAGVKIGLNFDAWLENQSEILDSGFVVGKAFLTILFYVLLLIGVLLHSRRGRQLIKIWLVFAIFVVSVDIFIFSISLIFNLPLSGIGIFALVIEWIVRIYCIDVVSTYKNEMKREELREQYEKSVESSPDDEHKLPEELYF